jgi:hypothetical protein
MPPNEECPNCRQIVEDWHVEWYKNERSALYQGHVAMDCPLCGQPVSFQGGNIGSAPPSVPLVKRSADKAAEWAALGATYAGASLHGYISTTGAGSQYVNYWTSHEVHQADSDEKARNQGP